MKLRRVAAVILVILLVVCSTPMPSSHADICDVNAPTDECKG